MLMRDKTETATIHARAEVQPIRLLQYLLLFSCWTCISSANILTDVPKNNPLDIDFSPAPAPEDGPPLSAGASRDPSILPAQIGGIIGAYLFSVCIVGVVLIILGKRHRQTVQRSATALDIEMLEPQYIKTIDISPTTPGTTLAARNFSWPSPEKTDRNPYIFPTTIRQPQSPPAAGDPHIDMRVVEADREMLNRNLEDLYAHVMEQEEAKERGEDVSQLPAPAGLDGGWVPQGAPQRSNSPPKKLGKTKPSSLEIGQQSSLKSRSSSLFSAFSPRKKGVKGMSISSPLPTPLSGSFPVAYTSDEEPLSPRYYTPPPPPPVPTDQAPYTHSRNVSSATSPIHGTYEHSAQENGNNRSVTHFHRPNQSQTSVQSSRGDPISATSATSQTPLFTAISSPMHPPPQKKGSQPTLQAPPSHSQAHNHPNPTASNPPSNNSSMRALPLRQFEPALASPSFSQTTKTTVLERTSPLSPGLNTAGQPRTPWSAGAVPYSPYQPFTPMIPVTPRLVTKEERKMMKKKEARTPVLEMIKSDDELFDSGY